jgi:hypothetical protein
MRLSLIAALTLLSHTPAFSSDRIQGVVELFTSQGCSSCPPADALFEELAKQRGLAVLSLPVDYWDRLGWKDTYGSPAHSARQRAYAATRGDRSVYTPQAVVNGTRHMNGADRDEIETNLDQLSSTLSVPITLTQSRGVLHLTVGAAPTAAAATAATIVLIPYFARREVAIGRGENAKRRIAYTNIARALDVVGTWTGSAQTFELPRQENDDTDGVMVLLQSGTLDEPGPIIGAAQLDLTR